MLLTARLDGPSPGDREAARRRRDGGRGGRAEGEGVHRRPRDPVRLEQSTAGTGYGGYDESFREAAALLEASRPDVTLDDKPELFPAGGVRECTLYCGWYSLANFVELRVREGGGGLAPGEFRGGDAAQPGREAVVPEPAQGRGGGDHRPGGRAVHGGLSRSRPSSSGSWRPASTRWPSVTPRRCCSSAGMAVLVGDPLYNPFAKSPRVKEADVKPSPKGAPSCVVK